MIFRTFNWIVKRRFKILVKMKMSIIHGRESMSATRSDNEREEIEEKTVSSEKQL